MDIDFLLYEIPYALYSATATLTEPGGAVHKLQISSTLRLTVDAWKSSAPVRWQPMQDGTNAVIIGVSIWLAE